MRFCTGCRHLTAGSPSFCPSCGRTYNVKLCPKLHVNDRTVNICSECGSRELSIPQPRLLLLSLAFVALRALFGSALFAATGIYAIAFAVTLVRDPTNLLGPMLVGLALGLCWLLLIGLMSKRRRK